MSYILKACLHLILTMLYGAAGVNAWETAGPGKARAQIEIEPPVTRRQAAARAAARAKAASEDGPEEGSGDEGSQGAGFHGAGATADAGPPDAGSDDAGEGLAPCARSRVGRSEAACRAGSCADECHEPHVFALQVGSDMRCSWCADGCFASASLVLNACDACAAALPEAPCIVHSGGWHTPCVSVNGIERRGRSVVLWACPRLQLGHVQGYSSSDQLC